MAYVIRNLATKNMLLSASTRAQCVRELSRLGILPDHLPALPKAGRQLVIAFPGLRAGDSFTIEGQK